MTLGTVNLVHNLDFSNDCESRVGSPISFTSEPPIRMYGSRGHLPHKFATLNRDQEETMDDIENTLIGPFKGLTIGRDSTISKINKPDKEYKSLRKNETQCKKPIKGT
jgi:hypothetical protein